jgi:DNA-binding transcriptional ArsR family regulator
MVKYQTGLDAVFAALADPTRRRILERLARGEQSAGALGSGFPISQPAISKHLKVLEEAGLLKRRIDGRVHHLRLSPRRMQSALAWLETQRRFWNASFDRLDDYLSTESEGKKKR